MLNLTETTLTGFWRSFLIDLLSLVTPVLDYADKVNIPVVLEIHNYDNVGFYEHFGFDLVKTIKSGSEKISVVPFLKVLSPP